MHRDFWTLWEAASPDADAEDAWQLPPYYLGQLTLGSASPGPPSSDLTRHQVVDGRQRILMLCLLLGAARRCLLRETAGMQSASSGQRRTAAEQISQLLSGDLLEGLAEQDTALLHRLLLEPEFDYHKHAAGETQLKLCKCFEHLYLDLVVEPLSRLLLLVQFILTRVTATVTILPGEEEPSLQADIEGQQQAHGKQQAQQKGHGQGPGSSLPASPTLCLDHLPDGSEQLAGCADITVTMEGRQLPLHSAMLAVGCRALRHALCSGGACDAARNSSASGAAAVQAVLEGQPLPGVLLFLRCLYSGCAIAAEDDSDPMAVASAAALAHALDAPHVLQACDAQLCSMLGPTADWPAWLALADRYSLRQLKWAAAERVLTDLIKHCSKEERRQALQKMGKLSASTYRLLFETTLETAASYRSELSSYKTTNT